MQGIGMPSLTAVVTTLRQESWALVTAFLKNGSKQQVAKVGIGDEGLFNLAEEGGTNDAAAPPHKGDTAVIEVPFVFLGGGTH